MKRSTIVAALIVSLGIALISLIVPLGITGLFSPSEESAPTVATTTEPVVEVEPERPIPESCMRFQAGSAMLLTEEQCKWMYQLALCESGDNPIAVNQMDRDGTPSYGLFQFKPPTLILFSQWLTIHIDQSNVMSAIYDRSVQEAAVAEMLLHYDQVNWRQQFPDCINKYIGMPPRS